MHGRRRVGAAYCNADRVRLAGGATSKLFVLTTYTPGTQLAFTVTDGSTIWGGGGAGEGARAGGQAMAHAAGCDGGAGRS